MDFQLLSKAVFYSHKIPLTVYDTAIHGTLYSDHLPYDYPALFDFENADRSWIYDCAASKSIRFHTGSLGFLWVGIPYKANVCLMGPLSITRLSNTLLTAALKTKNLSLEKQNILSTVYSKLPVIPYLEVSRLVRFFYYCLNDKENPELTKDFFDTTRKELGHDEDEAYYTQERNFIASRKIELQIREYVSQGAVEKIRLLNRNMVPNIGHLAKTPLRQIQNNFIVFITIVCRAAADAGLPIEVTYPLCDAYVMQCEALTDVNQVWQLHTKMLLDVTEKVRDFKYKLNYSKTINDCCGYIFSHINTPLKLQDIAEHLEINAEYLSRKFKKEVGTPILDFIHQAKISEAKDLLLHTDMTLSVISARLGFSSQSQFTTIFKKETGLTPGQFRND